MQQLFLFKIDLLNLKGIVVKADVGCTRVVASKCSVLTYTCTLKLDKVASKRARVVFKSLCRVKLRTIREYAGP